MGLRKGVQDLLTLPARCAQSLLTGHAQGWLRDAHIAALQRVQGHQQILCILPE
ncbi:hypothetical protein ACFQ36_01155 [Arthrobacter sp. GCM10027362]|uniref:hypothetical protein n=1 Tax=Arthrobacter sp. GCM10027362 TaxID=3273379 RepID=UPI00363B9AC5